MPVSLSQRFTGALAQANIYNGTAVGFVPPQSVLSIYATMDANVATDVATISLTATQGGTSQAPVAAGFNIGQAEGTGQGPVIPDDMVLFNWGVPALSNMLAPLAQTAIADVVRVKTFLSP